MKNFFPAVATTFIIGGRRGRSSIWLDGFDSVIMASKKNCGGGLILYENVTFTDSDVVLPITALGDKRMLYSFGKNFGTVTITGTIYNANPKLIYFTSISKLYDKFNEERTSTRLETINLSILSGFKCKLYVTSFTVHGANPQNQSISFTIEGTVCPINNKGSNDNNTA